MSDAILGVLIGGCISWGGFVLTGLLNFKIEKKRNLFDQRKEIYCEILEKLRLLNRGGQRNAAVLEQIYNLSIKLEIFGSHEIINQVKNILTSNSDECIEELVKLIRKELGVSGLWE